MWITLKIYIYVDEAGTLVLGDVDRFFLLSCYITDTPNIIKSELLTLQNKILNEPYYAFDIERFKQQGFHACDNHPDIRSGYYKLLLRLNIRIYSIVIDKYSDFFKNLTKRFSISRELYSFFVRELLYDRLLSERRNKIHIIFEEYGSSITKHKTDMTDVLMRIMREMKCNGVKDKISFDVDVHSKDDILLSVIDYVNYVLFQMLKDIDPKNNVRMNANFKLIEPKIANLHSLHNSQYYHSRKNINFEEIKGRLEVK